jgi:hypothetical protein
MIVLVFGPLTIPWIAKSMKIEKTIAISTKNLEFLKEASKTIHVP